MTDRSSPAPELDPDAPRRPEPTRTLPAGYGVLAGTVAAALAVGLSLLVAQWLHTLSPTDAVGQRVIAHSPGWLKRLAISWFGTSDKRALRTGIFVVMGALAIAIGVTARRRRWIAPVGLLAFGVLGALAGRGLPGAGPGVIVGPVVGALCGSLALVALLAVADGRWRQRRTPQRSRAPLGLDRRRFLVGVAATGSVAAVAGVTAIDLERRRVHRIEASAPKVLPAAQGAPSSPSTTVDPRFAAIESTTPYLTPNGEFYRIDTALSFPQIDLASWKLRVTGMVDHELEFTYRDLLSMPQVTHTVTLCCVSNEVGGDLISNALWQGVRLSEVLAQAGVREGAQQIFSTSVDGWTSGFPVAAALDGRDAMIALGMNGAPLPLEHGFPARLVVPGLYGYVSATKWLSSIELTTWAANVGYWVPFGWSREAPVKTESRIDVPKRGDTVRAGLVGLAGVAWAQHRGIARVEVSIDNGPWQQATLGSADIDDAWRQWVFAWQASAGSHTVRVRATDKTGAIQTDQISSPDPDGATGYHTRRFNVV